MPYNAGRNFLSGATKNTTALNNELIRKYAVAGPRYTSYPTVPFWDSEKPETQAWIDRLKHTFFHSNEEKGISLYIHLPFCESLCTYCGCNTRITKNHAVEEPYIQALLKEWSLYLDAFEASPRIAEVHLGGGTPTFFSPQNLYNLIEAILSSATVIPDAEFSFEGHPANTTEEHLELLARLGFKRVSYGIQDFDPKVQKAIHRMQTEEDVARIVELSRKHGYTSINFDLVYGLPFQTRESMQQTLDTVVRLRPDRLAFYSYAHVPWMKPGQRQFTEMDLPEPELKRALYEMGLAEFERAGYREVGMDHFALPDDSLFEAARQGLLNRNFMGYTTTRSRLLIGLGVSAISDAWSAYIQNEKVLETYLNRVNQGMLPFFKGHLLTREDMVTRGHITRLMCRFETQWENTIRQSESLFEGLNRLDGFIKDGLIELEPFHLKILPKGRPFVRNICMAFDARLWRKQPQTNLFSSTV